MLCFRQSQLYVSYMCKRIFKFELQISSYSQNIKFSRYCPKFHIFGNIVNFQVYLQLFRTTASTLYILWQGHVRNTLFHFCQLPPVKKKKSNFENKSQSTLIGLRKSLNIPLNTVDDFHTMIELLISVHFKLAVISIDLTIVAHAYWQFWVLDFHVEVLVYVLCFAPRTIQNLLVHKLTLPHENLKLKNIFMCMYIL